MSKITKREIMENPNLTSQEKLKALQEYRREYRKLTDDELLELVRTFTRENGREPMKSDLVYDAVLKERFGPWNRMLERAGTRAVSEKYTEKQKRKATKRINSRRKKESEPLLQKT